MAIANTNTNNIFQGGGELFVGGVSMGIISEDDITISGLFGEPTVVGSSTTGETGVAAFYKGNKPMIEATLRELDKHKIGLLFDGAIDAASTSATDATTGSLTQSSAAGTAIPTKEVIFYPHINGYISDTNNPYALKFTRAVVVGDLSIAFNPTTPSTIEVSIEALKNFDGNTWELANITA